VSPENLSTLRSCKPFPLKQLDLKLAGPAGCPDWENLDLPRHRLPIEPEWSTPCGPGGALCGTGFQRYA